VTAVCAFRSEEVFSRARFLLPIRFGCVPLACEAHDAVAFIYRAVGGHIVLRAMVAGICLLPPTLMMGATLPAIARFVETTPAGVSWLGFFYGGNIGGAVLGSLLAGFYLLRVFDMAVATYVAVLLSVNVRCESWFPFIDIVTRSWRVSAAKVSAVVV
jgi:hypothetical protein